MYEETTIIEEKAKEVLIGNGLYQIVPFDPVKLAQLNGIDVKSATFTDSEIAGMISKKDGKTVIYVNDSDPYNRKRFTISHELGHYFLELIGKDNDSYIDRYRTINGSGSPEEINANKFAAAILMDEVLVKAAWNDLKSVQMIAEVFKVSFEAMSNRLNKLRLIP
jgi:Zn-dependent peptidase ImmA (M78 family)